MLFIVILCGHCRMVLDHDAFAFGIEHFTVFGGVLLNDGQVRYHHDHPLHSVPPRMFQGEGHARKRFPSTSRHGQRKEACRLCRLCQAVFKHSATQLIKFAGRIKLVPVRLQSLQ